MAKRYSKDIDKRLVRLNKKYPTPNIKYKNIDDVSDDDILTVSGNPISSSKNWNKKWAKVNAWLAYIEETVYKIEAELVIMTAVRLKKHGRKIGTKSPSEVAYESMLSKMKGIRESLRIQQITLSRDLTKHTSELNRSMKE